MTTKKDKYVEDDLVRLSDFKDYEVADDDPDVRGWEVFSGDNKLIGKVDELIVDIDALKVRYLDVIVSDKIEGTGSNRHLLIPIGAAALDEKKDHVNVSSIETVTLLKLPEYFGGRIERDYERSVRSAFRPDEKFNVNDGFYESDLYDSDRFYSKRRKRFNRLSEIDARNVPGYNQDVRGWDVISSDGVRIGIVNEILVDAENNKVRYLDITEKVNNKHILIPVGVASIGKDDDNVYLNIRSETLTRLPLFKGDTISREYEYTLVNAIDKDVSRSEKDFYGSEHFDEMRLYQTRK